jgi:hypothetical protein
VKRATRNKILLWIILLGLTNFAAYTFFYWYFQGDARNGFIRVEETGVKYYLRGHFLHSRDGRETAAVTRGVWVYSFIHSITIWPTIGGVLVSMFILARPHIIATVKADAIISGLTVVNLCIFVVVVGTFLSTIIFIFNLLQALDAAAAGRNYGL